MLFNCKLRTLPFCRNYKCKHVVAMLLHINAKRNFNVLASTDLPQKWGKGQKRAVGEKYAPRKIVNLPGLEKVSYETSIHAQRF